MKLSGRLQQIADRIKPGETMADIGTDHGFLPLYLLHADICPRAILVDVSKGSLKKAADNCKMVEEKTGRKIRAELRLGDGLDVLCPGEVDVVVMAGIGGQLMRDILDWDCAKSRSMKRYILQPRNHAGLVRKWLFFHGFAIVEETLVPEGNYICEIITVAAGEKPAAGPEHIPTDAKFWYPDHLLTFRNSWTKPYLERKLELEEDILRNIQENSRQPHAAALPAEANVRQIRHLLSQLEEEECHE